MACIPPVVCAASSSACMCAASHVPAHVPDALLDHMYSVDLVPATGDLHLLLPCSPGAIQLSEPSSYSPPVKGAVTIDESDTPSHRPTTTQHRACLEGSPRVPQSYDARERRREALASMQNKFSAGRRSYTSPQASSTWESHKPELRHLYIDEDKTLRDIMDLMESRGFRASAKMYKTRFKQWGFVKNNSREDVAMMLQVTRQRAAVGKATTFKRNGKTVRIDKYLRKAGIVFCDPSVPQLRRVLPRAVRCHTPPPEDPTRLRLPLPLLLKELLLQCLRDLSPSFSRLSRPVDGKYSATTELWDSPRYLKLACDLFAENRHSQAGSICRSAFNNIHTLVYPPRLDTLFNFLVSQLWWANRDVTLELWRYLGAYMSNVLGVHNEMYQLFRGLACYIESHGYEAYLDFMAECIDDILAVDEAVLVPQVWKRHQFVSWCQLIAMDVYFMNGFNRRADRIQARCAQALPRSRFFPRDRRMNEQLWRETFERHIALGCLSREQSRHEKFLRIAFVSYAKLLGERSGAPVMHPSLTRIQNVTVNLSKKHLNPSTITIYNRGYNLESKVLSFLCRDLGQRGFTNDFGSYPV